MQSEETARARSLIAERARLSSSACSAPPFVHACAFGMRFQRPSQRAAAVSGGRARAVASGEPPRVCVRIFRCAAAAVSSCHRRRARTRVDRAFHTVGARIASSAARARAFIADDANGPRVHRVRDLR